jgi:TM2 domain-containing membrane protein YozV
MYCRNCANQLDDRAIACTKCGLNPRAGTAFCQNCGKPAVSNAVVCTNCGVGLARAGFVSDPRASNKIPAGICGIVLGSLGIHKFILGYTTAGIIMLLVSIVGGFITCFLSWYAMALIGLIEGIIYLTKSDEEFVQTYVLNRREWF